MMSNAGEAQSGEEVHWSSTGRYRLVLTDDRDADGHQCERGRAFAGDRVVADVCRSRLFFGWAEGHPSGHDYLMFSSDDGGQTVVELDTGRRVDSPTEADRDDAFDFIRCLYHVSADRRMVVVEGCYWACPYEVVMCRLDDPMTIPWPEVGRSVYSNDPVGWTADGFTFGTDEDVGPPQGTSTGAGTEAEADGPKELGRFRKRKWLWTTDGQQHPLDERIEPRAD